MSTNFIHGLIALILVGITGLLMWAIDEFKRMEDKE